MLHIILLTLLMNAQNYSLETKKLMLIEAYVIEWILSTETKTLFY